MVSTGTETGLQVGRLNFNDLPEFIRENFTPSPPLRSYVALFRTRSAAVFGIHAHPIDVEVDMYAGGSARDFITVGMPDTAVRESRERIKSALVNSGFGYPSKSVTINLAPANVRKEGAGFDLPMALGILGAMGGVPSSDEFLLAGELSLDGSLRAVRGILSIVVCAREMGIPNVVVPSDNAAEAAVVEGINVYGASSLSEVVSILKQPLTAQVTRSSPHSVNGSSAHLPDFADVKGQTTAKRALEVAAAGGHNVILIGPPGSGKTMLARRTAGILPPFTFQEALEATQVHSIAGLLARGTGLLHHRPFRDPHHSVSNAGLIGGGIGTPRPGEISLAHHGVLFLDELPEFPRSVLEQLRQPLEEQCVTLARSSITLTFPANFMLIAAMNPCPCGFFGDPTRECRCTGGIIQRYLARISGPLLDRIDLHIEVPAVAYKELRGHATGASSQEIRERVQRCREIQLQRGMVNARIPSSQLRKICALDDAGEKTLELAVRKMGLSARAHDRILKVARTLADIGGSEHIQAKHVAEAVGYRSLDRNYWS